ncbi:MAG: NAD-dependent dihydropyrimidine dehydrogenase subunit PreA [Candidatus Omnitrophica bacterium]|nr:NAD-dependent dihydropyrimidine dehydrogenase subunit PreA [Candidatus Omnitrophota bacterium]
MSAMTPDLSTTYLGLRLRNPLVPSASPLTRTLEGVRRLEEAGAGAIVMYSLFEEQINHESEQLDHYLNYSSDSSPEALSYFPEMKNYNIGPEEYLELVSRAKRSIDIPLIGSLNGVSPGGWVRYAKAIEDAGADALELNVYFIPTDPMTSSGAVEEMYLDVVRRVRETIRIPLAVKISPYFSSTAWMCRRLHESGAQGVVLFNRFYQPDLDPETLEVVPDLVLSRADELRLPLRWAAILHGRVRADVAVSGGVHGSRDVIKAVMAGAAVAHMTSELLQKGIRRIPEILAEVRTWMTEHEYVSMDQMRGCMSQQHVAEPAVFERANYMKVLQSYRQDPTGRL